VTLIGVYTGQLGVLSFPQQIAVSVYSEGEVTGAGTHSTTFRIVDDLGGVLFSIPIPSPPTQFVAGRFAQFFSANFVAQRPGKISFIANDGQSDHILTSRNIAIAPPQMPMPFGPPT
jgi:hypothetical protein